MTGAVVRPAAGAPTERLRDFLDRHLYLSLATRNPDGSTHLVPVVHRFAGDGFQVATSSATRKARNLAADPAVTVTVDDRAATEWVSAVGTTELVAGAESRRLNREIQRRWMTAEGASRAFHDVSSIRPCTPSPTSPT